MVSVAEGASGAERGSAADVRRCGPGSGAEHGRRRAVEGTAGTGAGSVSPARPAVPPRPEPRRARGERRSRATQVRTAPDRIKDGPSTRWALREHRNHLREHRNPLLEHRNHRGPPPARSQGMHPSDARAARSVTARVLENCARYRDRSSAESECRRGMSARRARRVAARGSLAQPRRACCDMSESHR